MTSFYILLTSAILTGSILGYLLGALRIIMVCVKVAISFLAVYLFFEPMFQWLTNYFTMQLPYANLVSVFAVLLLSFVVLEVLTRPFLKFISRAHKNIFNRIAGMLGAAAVSAVACLFVMQYYTTVAMPQDLSDGLEQTGIAVAVEEKVKLVSDQLFTELQPVQVMAAEDIDPVKKGAVTLSFSTTQYTVRPSLESEMLQLINTERVKRGLRPLLFDSSLLKAARLHAADMLARGYFSHNTPEGTNPFQRLHTLNIHYRYAGENLALAPTLLQAHEGLMRSPGHKANILHPSYGRVGIAVLDAGIHGLVITQEFRD